MSAEKGPPPPYGMNAPPYPQQPPHQQPHVVITPNVLFGPTPSTTQCPSCQAQITTRAEEEITTKTHLITLLLCLFIGPCALFTYCCDSCKTTMHYCPSCGAYLGRYER